MSSLAEALISSGVAEKFKSIPPKDKTQWHQIFRVTLTKFEIPILIKVRCDHEGQGLKFLGGYKLNSIEAESEQEAKDKINQTLNDIQYNMKGTDLGCPLYWKLYA